MKRALVLMIAVLLACVGCSGLMMDVKDLDNTTAHITMRSDAPVAVMMPVIEADVDKERATEIAAMLHKEILEELADAGIKVSDEADQKIEVKVTHYKKGCGFCRGFFPVGSLPDSAVDGEATLVASSGNRKLVIQKTGSVTGMGAMGDQTEDNTEYFAKVLVSNLLKDGNQKSEKDEEKKEKEEKEEKDQKQDS